MLHRWTKFSLVALTLLAGLRANAQALDKVTVILNDGDKVQRYAFTQSFRDNDVSCGYQYYGIKVSFGLKSSSGSAQSLTVTLPAMDPIVVPSVTVLKDDDFRFTFSDRNEAFYPGVTFNAYDSSGLPKSSCTVSLSEFNGTHPTVKPVDYYHRMGQLRGQLRCSNLKYQYGGPSNGGVSALVDFSCPYSYY